MPCSLASQGRPSSRRPTGSALRSGPGGDGQGGDDGGQGVAADELQHHPPGLRRADPAQQRAEPVRQRFGMPGEVGRGLARDEPDGYPVGVPGGGDLARGRAGSPGPGGWGRRRRWPSPRPSGAGRTRPATCPAPGR